LQPLTSTNWQLRVEKQKANPRNNYLHWQLKHQLKLQKKV